MNEFESEKEKKQKFKNMAENFNIYLDELFDNISSDDGNRKKDNMDFSRYPFDQKYVSHFYINGLDNLVVDFAKFFE
ncbi:MULTISPECIES: hypothetical protein [unclassified Sedimentibacter]|uniref:hypothetical protein n=1 Tax=unclassified Sedimentibacter TaxID=2649220 RepID=UPI0027E1BB4F|nr:hypothetical protein [Sedimentibacter sp. MB35-C1]WMJ77325.1 hypothetical protein RBQ61_17440 [Sedimentibacter sp. MB35-C1]